MRKSALLWHCCNKKKVLPYQDYKCIQHKFTQFNDGKYIKIVYGFIRDLMFQYYKDMQLLWKKQHYYNSPLYFLLYMHPYLILCIVKVIHNSLWLEVWSDLLWCETEEILTDKELSHRCQGYRHKVWEGFKPWSNIVDFHNILVSIHEIGLWHMERGLLIYLGIVKHYYQINAFFWSCD